jgi:hypothetical protein
MKKGRQYVCFLMNYYWIWGLDRVATYYMGGKQKQKSVLRKMTHIVAFPSQNKRGYNFCGY